MSFSFYDREAKYKTGCGGMMTGLVLAFLLVTAAYDTDAFLKDSEPYIKIITGLIDPAKDFKDLNYFHEHAYLPYIRVFEKAEGALVNYTEFKQYLVVDF
jgi:hypothetical protein